MLFGFTALKDFFLFMLGVFGLPFFCMVHKMLVKWDAGTLDFEPTCPKPLLLEQERYMREYIRCLETRAEIEAVDL